MPRRTKILLWITAVVGAFIVFALAFPVLAPRVIDLAPVRGRIQAKLSEAIGGTVSFGRIDVAILPRPCVKARQLSIALPATFEATADSLSIYPKLLPLFIGKLRAARIDADAPDLTIRLADLAERERQAKRPDTLSALKRSLADAGTRLAALAPSLTVVIRRGRAVVSIENHPPFSIEGLEASVVLPPRGFSVRMACSASFWKGLAIDAKLDPRTLAAEGSLQVEELRPHLLNPYLFPDGRSPIGDSLVDLDLSFRTDKDGNRLVRGRGSAPHLRLSRDGKTLHIERARFKGAVELKEGQISIVLDDLEAASPRMTLKGELQADAAASQAGMTLTGSDIDIKELRTAVLFFAPDVHAVQAIFDVLRAGIVPAITFESSGKTASDLGRMEQMRITATLRDGSIDVPRSSLRLTGVGGKTVIAGGVLKAEGLSARMGNTTGRNGTLLLGLAGGDAPIHMDIPLQADLAELPPVLRAFVKNPVFTHEMDLLRDIRGTARGRLVLGERLRSMNVTADISSFDLRARYDRVPFPVRVSGGRFLLAGSSISLEHVRGTLGKSSLKELAARVHLTGRPRIEIASGDAALVLDELYPLLTSFPEVGEPLKSIDTVRGSLLLSLQHAIIPFAEPGGVQFTVVGNVNGLTISLKDLPGPVTVSRGAFTADRDTFAFANTDAAFLDASLHLDGRIDSYLLPGRAGAITAAGSAGEDSVRFLSQQFGIPPEFSVRAPLSLSQMRLSWQGGDTLACAGTLLFPAGPSVTFDVVRDPRVLTINDLQVRNGSDRFDGRLKLEGRVLDLAVSGTMQAKTVEKIFANAKLYDGSLSGDLRVHVPLDMPRQASARGTLEGRGLLLPLGLKSPVILESISLSADGTSVTAAPANITIGDTHLVFSGTLTPSFDAYFLDGDLWADTISLDAFRTAPAKERTAESEQPGRKQAAAGAVNFPLQGTVRLRADAVTSGSVKVSTVRADVTLKGSGFRGTLTEAAICGLSVAGTGSVTGDQVEFDLRAVATGQEVASTMTCLSQDAIQSTGVFGLKAHLTASGQARELLSKLGGTVEFTARNGTIRRGIVLMRVLTLLNVTELLRGKIPDPKKEGIAYKTFTVRGSVRDGTFQISEVVLDGSAVTISGSGTVDLPGKSIDAAFLVAPFKTFDAIINAIPGVRYIMGGNLIAVPVRVRGPLLEPTVDVMKPSDVGDQLVGLTTRVLKIPFKIVEPVLPAEPKKP